MYSDEEGQFVDIVFGLRSGPLNVQYPVEVAVSPQSASGGCGQYQLTNNHTSFY